jgi:hypothetical protein
VHFFKEGEENGPPKWTISAGLTPMRMPQITS